MKAGKVPRIFWARAVSETRMAEKGLCISSGFLSPENGRVKNRSYRKNQNMWKKCKKKTSCDYRWQITTSPKLCCQVHWSHWCHSPSHMVISQLDLKVWFWQVLQFPGSSFCSICNCWNHNQNHYGVLIVLGFSSEHTPEARISQKCKDPFLCE